MLLQKAELEFGGKECGLWYQMLKETNKKKNEDPRELDLAVARLYVILTIAVSRKCVGQRPDCNDLRSDDENADYSEF